MVFAEIDVVDLDACMPLDLCMGEDGICPVTHKPFKSGDSVFVLRDDDELVAKNQPIKCISMTGLREIAMSDKAVKQGGFDDPYHREEGKLHVLKDYSPYIMFNRTEMESICQRTPDYVSSRIQRGTRIQIQNLDQIGSDINGFFGIVMDYDMEMSRYEIRINYEGQPAVDVFGLKRENLRIVDPSEPDPPRQYLSDPPEGSEHVASAQNSDWKYSNLFSLLFMFFIFIMGYLSSFLHSKNE